MNRVADIREIEANPYWQNHGQRLGDGEPPEVIMEVPPTVLQLYGTAHGGAIAGLMDSAIAVAVNYELPPDKGAATIELKLNYLRPIKGGTVRAQGQVISRGKIIVVGEGRIWDEDGELAAIGTATFRVFERKK